jgi:hypothetical protein
MKRFPIRSISISLAFAVSAVLFFSGVYGGPLREWVFSATGWDSLILTAFGIVLACLAVFYAISVCGKEEYEKCPMCGIMRNL